MSFDKDAVLQLTRIADALETLLGTKTSATKLSASTQAILEKAADADDLLEEDLLGEDDLPNAKDKLDEKVPGIEPNQCWLDANISYDDAKKIYHDNLDGVADLAKKKEECQEFNKQLQNSFAALQDSVSAQMMEYNEDQQLPKKVFTTIRKECTAAKKLFKQIAADAVDAYNEAEKGSSNNAGGKVDAAKERIQDFQKQNEATLKDLNQHMASVEAQCKKMVSEQLTGDAAKEVMGKFQNAVSGAKKASNLVIVQAEGKLLTDENMADIKGYWTHVVGVVDKAITEAEEAALDAENQGQVKGSLTKEDVTDKAKAFAAENGKETMGEVLKDAFADLPGDIGAITKLGDLDKVEGSQRQAAYAFIIAKLENFGKEEEEDEEDDLLG